jgi:DNA repair exonuclease SbcCD ATPase subunit
MRFIELELQNFLSFGNPAQIISLSNQGLVGITGEYKGTNNASSNGVGKSTIYEAIVWCLYGKTLRGYDGDDVVNRHVGKECYVSIKIEDEGKTYTIKRTRKCKSKRPNDLVLVVDGVVSSQGINADTQELVNSVVGMSFDTFIQSVLLSHGTKPFAAMNDKDQKEVLEDICQYRVIAKARDKCAKRISERNQLLTQVQTRIKSLQDQLVGAKLQHSKYTVERDQHNELLKKNLFDLKLKKMDTECSLEFDDGESLTLDQYYLALTVVKSNLNGIESEYATILDEERTCRQKYSNLKVTIATEEGELSSRLKRLNADLVAVSGMSGKQCPTCRQVLDKNKADECIVLWDKEKKDLDCKYDLLQKKKVEYNALERNDLQELVIRRDGLNNRKKLLSDALRNYELLALKRETLLRGMILVEKRVEGINSEIVSVLNTKNPYIQLVADLEKSVEECDSKLTLDKDKETVLLIELKHLNYWLQGFGNGGLKSFLLDSIIPFLNERAQYYADILYGGDLRVKFATQTQLESGEWREKFQVLVDNVYGADTYKGNSEGEKSRINIAVGWALGDLAATRAKKPIRFKGLDEPFESLDETGEDAVVRLLHTVLSQYETIFCTTHSTHLKNQFPKDIVVVKENGKAKIK